MEGGRREEREGGRREEREEREGGREEGGGRRGREGGRRERGRPLTATYIETSTSTVHGMGGPCAVGGMHLEPLKTG